VGECSIPVKPSSPGHRPRTRRSSLLPDQLPRGCGPSERSDELDLVRFALIRVIRRSWQFHQSARRPLAPRLRSSSPCSRTTASRCASLRPKWVHGVGEADVGVHGKQFGMALSPHPQTWPGQTVNRHFHARVLIRIRRQLWVSACSQASLVPILTLAVTNYRPFSHRPLRAKTPAHTRRGPSQRR